LQQVPFWFASSAACVRFAPSSAWYAVAAAAAAAASSAATSAAAAAASPAGSRAASAANQLCWRASQHVILVLRRGNYL
jgi:hypothetical protein